MSDDELIRLVQETPAEELTTAQVEQLRTRLRESPALQEVLIDQLHMESYLHNALGEFRISVDEIVRRARESDTARTGRTAAWLLGLGLAAIVLMVGIGRFVSEPVDAPPQEGPLVADVQIPSPVGAESESDELKAVVGTAPPEIGEQTERTANAVAKEAGTDASAAVAAAASRPAEAPQPAAEVGPWTELLSERAEPVAFEVSRFDGQDPANGPELPAEELREWLAELPGHPHRIDERRWGNRRFSGIDGFSRLRAPWTPDAVLRLGIFDPTGFKLHLWNGDEGVSLRFDERSRPRLWGAFHATREPGKPQPKELTLLTTDDGRHERSELGAIDLRHQNGALVMTRGDVRLLSVPMRAPPAEVIFEGRAWFTTLTMFRGRPVPAEPGPARRAVLASQVPAELQWVSSLGDAAEFNRSGDGSIELLTEARADVPPQLVWSATPVGRPGLYEAIVRIEQPEPGTGIYLGDAQGHPIHHVAYFRDRRTGGTTFGYGWSTYGYEPAGKRETEVDIDPNRLPVPYAGDGQWLKIVAGPGGLKLWCSGDGVHWGRALAAPIRDTRGTWASVGIYALTGEQPRRVRLRHVEVRELTPIVSLAPEELRDHVPITGPVDRLDVETWLAGAIEELPDGIALDDWLIASAIRTLEAGPSRELSQYLLRHLASRGVPRLRSTEEQIALLDDLSLLADAWSAADGARFALGYVGLIEAGRKRSPNAAALVASALVTSPLWTEARLTAAPSQLVRPALLSAIYMREWTRARDFCRRVRLWSRHAGPAQNGSGDEKQKQAVIDWADATAAQSLPAKERGDVPLVPREWGHPLVSQLSKEGYNVMAEFESALASRAYEDACQIITTAGTSGLVGMLPDSKDSELLVSMPRAIALAMRDHPDLRAAMQERFGPVGRLRVRQAMADANTVAVQEATVQFFGTDAAAEAHAWLGDRALAGGQFSQAADSYRDALRHTSGSLGHEIAGRLRLAAAMLGREAGERPSNPVDLGGKSLSPDEFEALVTDLRRVRAQTAAPAEPRSSAGSRQAPPPARYAAHVRGRFEGDVGQKSGRGPADTDWVARQLAITTDDELLYVGNRFQTTAYDLKSGAVRWSDRLGGDQGGAHDWPFVAMRPVVAGDKVFVRRLTKNGPELAALERASGKLLWRNRPDSHVASDPIYTRGELVAVIATFPEGGFVQLDLASFHPETGSVLAQRPLLRLRDMWNRRPVCQIATAGGKIVCSIGGSVLCCDINGQLNWLSRQTWLPAETDAARHLHHHEAPLIVEAEQVRDGRVIAAQPGVRAITCLEFDTGRRVWSAAVPGLRRVLGVGGAHVIAETDGGLTALDLESGNVAWTRAMTDRLHGHLVEGDGVLLVARMLSVGDGQQCPALTWLDVESGAEVATEPLRSLSNKVVHLGPMLAMDGRIWTFLGKGANEPQRDLIELRLDGERPSLSEDSVLAAWADHVDDASRQAAALVVPGWTLLTRQSPRETGFRAEHRGEPAVLAMRAVPARPVCFARRLTIPGGAQPKLVLRVGNAPGTSWTLAVRVAGEELSTTRIEDASTQNGWKTVDVDLGMFAGQTIWVVVVAQSPVEGSSAVDAFWKRLEFSMP